MTPASTVDDPEVVPRSPKQRVRAIAVVLVVVAACVGTAVELSSTTQKQTLAPVGDPNFGDVTVGTTSSPRTFRIDPASGPQSDTVQSITTAPGTCAGFTISAPGLPATVSNTCAGSPVATCTPQSYSFTATFTPPIVNVNPVNCAVTIRISGVNTTLTLTGKGVEEPVRMTVTPQTVAFGEVRVGDPAATGTVTITNKGRGPGPLNVTSVTLDQAALDAGMSIVTGNVGAHTLAPNNTSETFNLSCQPAAGMFVGNLTAIASNNTNPANNSSMVRLECTGIVSDLVFGPEVPAKVAGQQVGGATRVGEPVDLNVTVDNVGAANLTINSLTVEPASELVILSPSMPAGTTITPTATPLTVKLRYRATTALEPGSPIGTLTVNHDNNKNRALTITGGALPAGLSIAPDGIAKFPKPVCIGETGTLAFTLMTADKATFKIEEITQPAAPFSLVDVPAMPTTIEATTVVSFMAEFKPVDPTTITTTFQVKTDIPAEPDPGRTVTLQAVGLPSGVSPTPDIVDLGAVTFGEESRIEKVALTNCTAGTITLGQARITGANPGDFAIASSPAVSEVGPGASVEYEVVMRPTRNGTLNGTLEIAHDDGTATVRLLGDANGAPDKGNRNTYYACNAGEGSGSGWLAGVAIGLLGVLRRRSRLRR